MLQRGTHERPQPQLVSWSVGQMNAYSMRGASLNGRNTRPGRA